MLSYIGKGIVFFLFLYTLIVPYTITSPFAESHLASEKIDTQKTDNKDNVNAQVNESSKKNLNSNIREKNRIKKNDHTADSNTPGIIAKNIQMAGKILSSSPSELAEQAKSYAIGQFNNTVSSGAQKWLSQFGTVRINFGLDKKGTLKNNSFDLLLPLYDNKADWLLFSQLGYRNKDSRDTMNLGLGGRYFSQNWMYGLNTFYDYDLTGKNQRLGLGGEIGGDYIKLSANTYYRLTDWKDSRDFVGYYERPANGYDINGEFFLPAYPHLGAKLTYEQYFGDNVTLFNRDTKQKNPNLAKLGLTYTPVPLFTLGVDYKQGGSGHSETQFLANFNYKLGVPLSVQLAPENVAAARTLAGSRYDLVERNNHIVLEHQKKPIAQLSLPETIVGYSHEQHEITVKLSSNDFVKQIHWTTNEDFEKNGGKLSSRVGHTIKITLPTYLSGDNQNNNYPIYALAELEDGLKSAPVAMRVIVRPFILKKQERAYFTPAGPLPATGDKKDGYTFNPVITFDTAHGTPIKNTTISHVQWITDPKIGTDTGLQLLDWETSDAVALDEKGHFKRKPVLISSRPHKDVKVYLQLNSQPPQLVGEVSFDKHSASFHVDKVEVLPAVPSQVANGSQTYTYSAVVLDSDNHPVRNQKIANVNWSKDKNHDGLIWTPLNGEVTTDGDGKLTATLASTVEIKDVTVSLSIGGQQPVPAQSPVTFTADTQDYKVKGDIHIDSSGTVTADGHQKYTYRAIIVGIDGIPVFKKNISNATWKIEHPDNMPELTLDQSDKTTDDKGQLTATLTSIKAVKGVVVSLTVGKQPPVKAKPPVDFKSEQVSITPTPPSPILVGENYTLTVHVKDATGNNSEPNKQVNWTLKNPNQKGVTLSPTSSTTQGDGSATTTLTSTQAQTVTVEASVEGVETAASVDVEFKWPTIQKPTVTEKTGTVPADGDKDPQHAYHYTAHVVGADGKTPYTGQDIKFKWRLKSQAGGTPQNTWLSEKGEVTAQSDGTLKVQLLSSEKNPVVTGAIVCLAAVDEKSVEISETEQCAAPVDFKKPSEFFEITHLKVDGFNSNNPLLGDGKNSYTYTATIIQKKGNQIQIPHDGYQIDAKWETNFKAEMYNNNPEWEIKSNNIVQNGQITAILTSNVGIGNITNNQVSNGLIVILSVPDGEKTFSKKADAVVFEPVTQKEAWLHVYSDKKPGGNLYKEQNRPHNTFQGLKGQLVDKLTGKPISQSNDTVEITGGQISDLGEQDPNNKGVIHFDFSSGKTTLEMTVEKPNYAKYRYNYHFDIKRFFVSSANIDLIGTDSDADCTGGASINGIKNITNMDLVDEDDSLTKEFPRSFDWGILDQFDSAGKVSVIVPSYNGSTKYLFDLRTDKSPQDQYGQGYLLCVYKPY
ncbi:inverse autotransporter beta domain-containing protein [Xenorhabdus griffiniae]|uniref:Inverse autotransporter beta domain-containing protein n=1 Tax=Xenorhabdus griffiniae TaxID=351672 RepID=A0ABY9XMY8_9GAMM|nr:inverse autotransporter beta domain-containing protein [Xenorhabdus griffiniae]MBD1229386.1 inverse autotransporter beta domain-containing protein [Xenorhabdus griffiniae]MBE8589044.1 inverse autotransporter beta domain-containing protein [Xenorhabdus griffiniae]WMV74137.1 inverse autotransporter beta domain-containing protein [Xenorhabdus griffiniae]WNH03817.1 inverse autotransporter beta domain-containing protein [Xenorhabdus griffiniae]